MWGAEHPVCVKFLSKLSNWSWNFQRLDNSEATGQYWSFFHNFCQILNDWITLAQPSDSVQLYVARCLGVRGLFLWNHLKEPMLCFEFEQLWAPGCTIFSCRERLTTKTNEPFKMKVHGLGCVYSIYHNFASTRGSTWLFWIIIFQVQYQRQIHNTLFLKRLKDWRDICEGVWTNTSWI